MANTIEIVIKATDSASQVIAGVESKVSGSSKTLVKNLDEIGRSSQTAQQKLQDFGKGMSGLGDKMSLGVTLPLVAAGAAAVKFASDLNETTSKVGVLFGDMSEDMKAWANTAATSFGLSKKAALDGASDFAIFGKAAGLAGQDLTEFSKSNVKLASDMASFFNTSPEEAITAIGAAFRGESEPIRRYGVLLNDVALKDEALRQGLIKTTTDALTPQQRILAASALIMKQTGAAQGDFARTSDQLANSTRIAKAQLEDAAAALGTNLLPIVNKGVNFLNDLLKAFQTLSPEMQTAILAFGGIAAAMGPVMSVGGRLIGVFSSLAPVVAETATGMLATGKTVVETAGYLKQAGISAESLKFAFQNLKASGALLGGELAIIVAGLIAVAKYLGEVDAASKATNEDLIEMSHSGDMFKQAAATTEILTNGQERLKKTLDGVKAELESSKRTYADYRSSIEATAKAAGYEIDAQGNLRSAMDRGMGAGKQLIQTNYALSESEYAAGKAAHERGGIIDQGMKKLIEYGNQINVLASKQKEATTSGDALTRGLKDYYTSMRDANAEGLVRANEQAAQSIDILRTAMQGAVTKEFENFKNKQSELQGKADELQKVISTSYGKARDDAIKSLDDINIQLMGNVKAHDEATKRILFDIASQQLASIQDPQLRAKAMNELALQWNLVDKATYDATQNIIGATARLAEDKNLTAYQSALNGIATTAAGMPVAEVKIDTQGATQKLNEYDETLGSIPKEVTTTVKTVVDVAQGVAGDSMKERLAQLSTSVTTKVGVDTSQAEKDLKDYTANKIDLLPGVKKTEIVADTSKATADTNSILNLYNLIPIKKDTLVNVDGKDALQTLDDILKALNDLYSKTIVITTKYVTSGSPPSGAGYATGANFVVPPGFPNDTFPMRVSSGERVIVQPQGQAQAQPQQGNASQASSSGDVYNYTYTTNVYNPLAAAMLADKQRREKIARSNARMGVNA